jgi:methylglutaconyl-CoA hydratase
VLHRQLGQDRSRHRAMLKVEIESGVARVTLDRPEVRNAFDDALIRKLQSSFETLAKDASVRVVVLAGNGPAFCAGADLNWMKRMAGYGYAENLADAQALATMLATLERLPQPTIARVHGPAFAGGTGLVAACDIAVGTPEAKFCFSEAKLGLSPATISPYVIRAIGERMARRYFLSAEVFDAEEAHRIGMLSALVAPPELDSTIDGLLKHLLAGGPEAHAKIKDLIRAVSHRPIDAALSAETAKRIAEIRVSPEGKEGIASFLEKRKASWCSPKS